MDSKKLIENINNIIKNKNTITILIVIAGIIALYVVYNWRVTEATTLVNIPSAKKEINSRKQITEESIQTISVPKSLLSKATNLIKNVADVRDHYVNYGYTIPQYSLFYTEAILKENEKPGSPFADLKDGYTVYSLDVNFDSTYGNSMYPGNYIDLYVKVKDSDKILFGRLFKGIKIAGIYNGDGNDVFETRSEVRVPKYMWFAVQQEYYNLLKITQYIGAEIIPIPRNAGYSKEEREPEIDSKELQQYILAKAYTFTDNLDKVIDTDNINFNTDDYGEDNNQEDNNDQNNNVDNNNGMEDNNE